MRTKHIRRAFNTTSRQAFSRGIAVTKISEAIRSVQALNQPGLNLHEAGDTLTPRRVNELVTELAAAHDTLLRATSFEK